MAEMASSSSAPAPAPAPASASASGSASASKKSQGRRKVDMVKMTNESNLQVTFSKRRNGLFKKASELCTLCGVDVAIIVFSPGKKVFSFGHPCVESVVHRYITGIPPPASGSIDLVEAYQNSAIRDLNMQLTQVLSQLDMEKKRSEELNRMRKAAQAECWWEKPVGELELPQLEQLKAALEQLKNNVSNQAEKLFFHSLNTAPPLQPQFFAGSSSNAAAADPSGGMSNLPFGSSWNTGDPQAVFNPEMMLPPPPPPLLPPPPPQSQPQPQPHPGFQNPPFGQGFY